ncbi:MAG: hypothetical protein OEO77_09970 [Acidimicrobiia bacterium]|nr:hypothetical protein [Acidimicrobiia bacterium]
MTASTATVDRPVRSAVDVDWRRVLKWGGLMGLTMAFVASIGMLEAFDRRLIINPYLSLGYLAIGWIPFAFAYATAHEEVKEGIEAPVKGLRDVVAGAAAGLVGSAGLAVFIWMISTFSLRDIFVKLSPVLVRLLTFDTSVATGVLIWVAIMVGLGALAGVMHVVTPRLRKALFSGVAWALAVSLLEAIVKDAFDEVKLRWLSSWAYNLNGGLEAIPAIVIAIIAGIVAYRYGGTIPKARRTYAGLAPERRLRLSVIGIVLVLALFIGLPLIVGGIVNELLANVGLFLLMALGLNIVVGLAGLLDLGYVAFFAVGAYGMAVLTSPFSPRFAPALDFWVALPIVILIAAIAGLMVGTPVIRMRGDYLAIVTLGFGEIVRILFLSDWLSPYLGGAQGISRVPFIDLGPWEIKGSNPKSIFYLVAVFVVLAIYISWRLQNSRIGRAWTAMREDEDVALAMGINTVTAKLLAFVTGAILASFGGAIFAAKVGTVFPNSFSLLVSIIVLVVVIVGGMGNIPGVIVGALVLIGVLGGPTQPGLLQEFQEFKLLIYGVLLIYMMLKRPEGLVPSAMRSRELHHEELTQDAWLAKEPEPAADGGTA